MPDTIDPNMHYAHGIDCTWHGPIVACAPRRGGNLVACPKCGLYVIPIESQAAFFDKVRSAKENRDAEDMLRWSEGQCFPDLDTLENAYRQAMEGHS